MMTLIGAAMVTCEVAVMFDEGDKALIQSHADALGISFSEFVRRAALERVEDLEDTEAYNAALDGDDGIRYSMGEVAHMATEAE